MSILHFIYSLTETILGHSNLNVKLLTVRHQWHQVMAKRGMLYVAFAKHKNFIVTTVVYKTPILFYFSTLLMNDDLPDSKWLWSIHFDTWAGIRVKPVLGLHSPSCVKARVHQLASDVSSNQLPFVTCLCKQGLIYTRCDQTDID